MAISLSPDGGSKKKSLDAELNLIPFIDLLVCCICFLLITAVWLQLARINVSTPEGRSGGESLRMKPPKVAVLVGDEGYTISVGAERLAIPKEGHIYNTEALHQQLVRVKSRLEGARITVAVEDGVRYRHLVRAMDIALAAHFNRIKVSDAAARL